MAANVDKGEIIGMDKILLVEDDQALAMGTEYSLKAEGYLVVIARNIEEARQQIENDGDISLILLDVMLPDGTGFEFCREIRERGMTVPVIFLTAVAEEANIVQGLDMGADDYVTKPFRVKELLSRVKAALRRQNQYAKIEGQSGKENAISYMALNRIQLKNYVLDLENYRLYQGDTLVDCTPSEFRLLRELVLHWGQVLTREQLMERLWDVDGSFVDDNTLSVYIKRLRDKLPELKDSIQTVRGIGYQFVEKKI